MTELQIIQHISSALSLSAKQVQTTATLIDEGATIPFLARYRKEATGGLDEEQLRSVRDMLEFHRTLEARKQTILKSIKEQDKLTPELEEKIKACKDMQTLEDLYLPYMKKRKTKGDMAKEKGLEPLAQLIWDQKIENGNPLDYAREYISAENEIPDADTALTTSLDIVAEWINESVEVRDTLRAIMRKHGVITSKKNPAVKERTNFEDYYEFRNRVPYIKPHLSLIHI